MLKLKFLGNICCIQQRDQVDSTVMWSNCNVCIEENKQCNGDHIIVEDRNNTNTTEDSANIDTKHDANADCSFVHAVINMVGMLIGNFYILLLFFPYL